MTTKYHGDTTAGYDSYVYNMQGRLATFSPVGGGSAVTYAYNPSGIRTQKAITGGATTDYLIDAYNPTGFG